MDTFWNIFTSASTRFCCKRIRHEWLRLEFVWEDAHFLLSIAWQRHLFSVVPWIDRIFTKNSEGCTHFCELFTRCWSCQEFNSHVWVLTKEKKKKKNCCAFDIFEHVFTASFRSCLCPLPPRQKHMCVMMSSEVSWVRASVTGVAPGCAQVVTTKHWLWGGGCETREEWLLFVFGFVKEVPCKERKAGGMRLSGR